MLIIGMNYDEDSFPYQIAVRLLYNQASSSAHSLAGFNKKTVRILWGPFSKNFPTRDV